MSRNFHFALALGAIIVAAESCAAAAQAQLWTLERAAVIGEGPDEERSPGDSGRVVSGNGRVYIARYHFIRPD